MRETEREISDAQDAIPKNAILLTDAYQQLVDLIVEHPERVPEFDEEWSEALKKTRKYEREELGHDPEVFDKELEEYWHCRAKANLLLRLELEAQRLIACVRDPRTGDVLRLRADDWIPADWDEYIPAGIWSDHIDNDSYEAPGPEGSLIHEARRPVFFLWNEFDALLKDRFQHAIGASSQSDNIALRRTQRNAVKEAVSALWGNSVPAGIRAKVRDSRINEWLVKNGREEASEQTIRRALNEMRDPP